MGQAEVKMREYQNECENCGHTWYDNDGDNPCPKCGEPEDISTDVAQ